MKAGTKKPPPGNRIVSTRKPPQTSPAAFSIHGVTDGAWSQGATSPSEMGSITVLPVDHNDFNMGVAAKKLPILQQDHCHNLNSLMARKYADFTVDLKSFRYKMS